MSKSFVSVVFAAVLFTACADQPDPLDPFQRAADVGEAEPSPIGTVSAAGTELFFWPYTSAAIDGPESDPINLVFPNRDPREIRESLLSLDGNRTAFGMPNAAPFNCIWKDAVGGAQVKIGRASCRERVWNPPGRGSDNKTQKTERREHRGASTT